MAESINTLENESQGSKGMKIIADHREQRSGLLELLTDQGFDVQVDTLSFGDYLIGNELMVERKTANDFILSIIDGRLFSQVASLKKHCRSPLLLIEGNPFATELKMDPRAIRGAILSVQATWYMPTIYSKNPEDTCLVFETLYNQVMAEKEALTLRHGYRPKRLKSRQLFIVQGLPGVGPVMAKRLLDKFGSVKNILNASEEGLLAVEGVGPKMVEQILKTIS